MAQRKTQLEYKPEFLKYGFTEMRERSGNVRPQCVQCLQVLANESMKENKLKRHLHSVHPKFVEKQLSYWKDKEEQTKRSRIDAPSSTAFSLEKASLASFEVAWIIARCKKPHNIGEELVKPAAVAMVKTIGGADIAKKVESVPLSDNSIKRRIDLISEDILAQLIVALKKAGTFSLQTDESVDIAGNPQLMVFVRYRGEDDIQEEFLFCNALSTTTTGEDIFNMMNNFLKKHDLNWLNCLAVCTDGAPSMMGSRLGFVTRIKAENPDVIIIHCFLHRENLASHRLQPDLHAVLNDAIQIVNFVKARALNSRIFHKMCEEMGSPHQDLLFHSDVRWLSRGNILGRVIELKTEIEIFLREKKHALADCFKDVAWLAKLAYLGDIFMHLNELNSDMQGRNHTMVDIGEKIVSFKKKIALWREKLARGKTAAFPELSAVLEDSSEISLVDIKNIFEDHLKNLQEEMDRYFPENVDLKKHSWIRNVFSVNVSEVGEDIPGFQEELIDLQENQVQKQHFENLQYSKFWTQLKDKPILTREAEKALLPFPTTYLCEQGFSSLVTIKTKARNRLDPQHDLRCALTINIKPNLEDLTHKMKQFHGSH